MPNEQCPICKERLYPENPSQPFYLNGRYLRPICESCPEYNSAREKPQEQVIIHRHSNLSKQEWDLFQQTVRKVQYLEKQLRELSKPKKKPEAKYGYKGIR